MIYSMLLGTSVLLAFLSFFSLYKAYDGPTAADRVVAINMIATKVTVLIVIFAMMTGQDGFIDVALAYSMMGFVATVCVSKYIEKGTLS
jgi:multicomponent Na+:H+ antiporter subunit F